MRPYFLLLFMFFLSSCLLTHKEIEEELELGHSDNEETVDGQADGQENQKEQHKKSVTAHGVSVVEKISQMEVSIRELRGQVEKMDKVQEDRVAELEKGLLSLIQTLDLRVATLAEEVKNKKQQKNSVSKDDPDRFFKEAEKLFKEEKWKAAIINYEKYREKNKKGQFYRKSTFQIGLCFQKLSMSKEAKVFFREVVESFPKSAEAKEAKKLLSQ